MKSTGDLAGNRVRVICGPTAAGKSGIATRLAIEYGGTIISADSRQIYRGFDIGTAKPGSSEMRVVPHRGIDVADPAERYSASRWATEAKSWIAEAANDGRVALIVGGTGFYIKALVDPLFDAPPLDPTKREQLESWMGRQATERLREWCARIDPAKALLGRVQLARAIEISLLTGHRLSDLQLASTNTSDRTEFVAHYLVVDPGGKLGSHIEHRVDAMIDAGWTDEVRSLMAHVPDDAPAWKASGYRTMKSFVSGEIDLSSARARIIIETRQYAKRQRTWFRHQLGAASVTRVNPDDPNCDAAVERWWKEGVFT
ncbi:MAG TPA: tRNA (adenosine(37)-N6)-dimethylallyltransferase MiaA [Gemmatimonadaceae bacterium]|nr:tRNA (adenosine(37)-N6)-dimethylallyltransferase MiaA [Gemmatimonadaceae bacterium]